MVPDTYWLKVEAAGFKDEWWQDAPHRTTAVPLPLLGRDNLVLDFDLAPGQGPAWLEITSDPAGAQVYVDHVPTTNITPALVDLGEIGKRDWNGQKLAPHVIGLKKSGVPRPSPRSLAAREAETVSMHFDLVGTAAGAVALATAPTGVTVYVDYADQAEGISPIVVGNLAPGSHVVMLKSPEHLQARTVLAWVQDAQTNEIAIPLLPLTAPDRIVAEVRSVPPGAQVYVDYVALTNLTDVVVDWMDPASHTGAGWHSRPHTVLARKPGYHTPLPRLVAEVTNSPQLILVNLAKTGGPAEDADHDGLPDDWEQSYRLDERAPGQGGANDDPDLDGLTNDQERQAGTDPLDQQSAFEIPEMGMVTSPEAGRQLTMTFETIPGRTYLLQVAEQLTAWVNAGSFFVATSDQTEFVLPAAGLDARYYRLLVLTP